MKSSVSFGLNLLMKVPTGTSSELIFMAVTDAPPVNYAKYTKKAHLA